MCGCFPVGVGIRCLVLVLVSWKLVCRGNLFGISVGIGASISIGISGGIGIGINTSLLSRADCYGYQYRYQCWEVGVGCCTIGLLSQANCYRGYRGFRGFRGFAAGLVWLWGFPGYRAEVSRTVPSTNPPQADL